MRSQRPVPTEAVVESARWVPAGPLRGLIAGYDGYRVRGAQPARHLGLPSPFMTMIVTLDEPLHIVRHLDRGQPPSDYASLVGGLHAIPVVIGHDGAQSGVQLRVSPLASRALLGVPAGELASVDVAAEDVIGNLAGELRERIAGATGWRERFEILDAALSRRLDGKPQVPAALVHAWRLILGGGGAIPVARIAREVGFSERHLTKRFQREIGLTPKRASRVVRFDRTRRLLQARLQEDGRVDMAWAAARCGYSDQSHLVRDFREFAELPPSRWLRQEFANVQDGPAASAYGSAHDSNITSRSGLADAARP